MRSATGNGFVGQVSAQDRDRILRDDAIISGHLGIMGWYRIKLREQSEKAHRGRATKRGVRSVVRVAFQSKSGKTIVRDADEGSDRLRRLLKRRGARRLP